MLSRDETASLQPEERAPSPGLVGGSTQTVWRNDVSELEQQLWVAESRCDTLKQQLDYMKMLYRGNDSPPEEAPKIKKEKSGSRRRSRAADRLTTGSPVDHKESHASMRKSHTSIATNTDCEQSKQKEKDIFPKLIMDLTHVSCADIPVRDRSSEVASSDLKCNSNNPTEGSSAVKVIQDILCGISDSVNRISQLNVHINDGNSDRNHIAVNNSTIPVQAVHNCRSECSVNKENICREEIHRHKKVRSHVGHRSTRQEVNLNQTSDSIETMHDTPKRKSRKSQRYNFNPPPISQQPQLSKTHPYRSKQEKHNTTHFSMSPTPPSKGTALVESSPSKIKKKRIKAKEPTIYDGAECNKTHSRESVNNVVELYHNKSAHLTTCVSDENTKQCDHNISLSTLRVTDLECSSRRDSDEMIAVERLKQSDLFDEPPNIPLPPVPPPPPHVPPVTVVPPVIAEPFSNEDVYHLAPKRNFQLPTLSSKLKQVDRNFYPRFNFRNIPFVVGKSTTPSHNLGLNIQQALSIIKARNPSACGISLSSGGNYLHDHSMLSSGHTHAHTSSSSRGGNVRRSFCPLAAAQRSSYQPSCHGDVPECDDINSFPVQHSEKTLSELDVGSRKMSTMDHFDPYVTDSKSDGLHFSPSHQSERVWDLDQEEVTKPNSKLRCGCFPTRQCIDYQKLLNQYLESGEGMSFFQLLEPPSVPSHRSSCRSRNSDRFRNNSVSMQALFESKHVLDKNFNPPIHSRGLKEVLVNLHDDFLRLSAKYEELQNGVNHVSAHDIDALKQLEAIEAELQTKEDEISVVMAVYKEVLSLKEQVKALRHRASIQSMGSNGGGSGKSQHLVTLREPTISVRLTKLLRTVQQFQNKLKDQL